METTKESNKGKGRAFGLSYPMLARSNYIVWAMKMKVFMHPHEVWEAIEPSDPKTPVVKKKDTISLAMIYGGVPEEMLLALAKKKTVKEAWVTMKTLCQGAEMVKKERIQTLKSEFESLNMKDVESLDDFTMNLNSLVTNIRVLGKDIKESYVVKKLLRAVQKRFLPITSTKEQFGDLENMTMEEAIGSLKEYEERGIGNSESVGAQLMLIAEEWEKKDGEEKKLLYTREEWVSRSIL